MDETILISAFSASLGSSNEARMQAEEYLQKIRSNPGLIPILLKLSLDAQHTLELRQSAVIYLKNLTKNWKDSINDFSIPIEDKNFLKLHLINCLDFSIPEKIRSQFEEIAHNITKIDYPWDQIINQISIALEDGQKVYAGLNMIYQISRNYEYVMNERRKDLLVLVENFFSSILLILKNLIGFPNIESYSYVQIILQIYWVSFYIDLHNEQAEIPVLEQWLNCFKVIISAPFNELQNKPETEEQEKIQEKFPQWMCKKWASQIVHRFFNRYYNLNHLREQNLRIGQYFQSVWACEFFKVITPQLFQVKEKFIPSLLLNYYIKYTTQAVKFGPTFSLLDENSISHILINVIMPIIYRVKSDDEIWRENPIEFIRKEADLGKAYYSPKSSAIDLLLTLCEKGILVKFFQYISIELQQSSDLLKKEALLLALGSLSEQIKKNTALKDHVESLLINFVYPEFSNPIGFLRSRSAWVYSRFANLDLSTAENKTTPENLNFKTKGLEAVCKLLIDSELPVRYEAGVALPKLLSWSVSKIRLSGELKNLLEIYLKLINEIDSEDVVESLESIVSAFPKEIIPFSLELAQHLASAFTRMIGKDLNEDDGESAMAAVSTLNTIGKIIDVLEDRPEDLTKLSFILQPIFEYCLSEIGCDYFEEALNLLTCLLYYSPDGSLPHLYYLIKHLKASILGQDQETPYAIEHVNEVYSSIANFIKKYKEKTMENMAGILEIGFLLLKDREQDAVNGCKILIALLENYKGAIDGIIVEIIKVISSTFELTKIKSLKISCSQTIFVALWNSPLITLSAGPLVSPLFEFALANLKFFSEDIGRNHLIYGLGSLFYLIPQLPPGLQNTLPAIFKSILLLCKDPDEESSIEVEEFEEGNRGVVNLDAQCQKIIDKIRAGGCDAEDDDSDFPYCNDAEDLYDSPFEEMNQNDFIKEIAKLLKNNYNELYQSIISILSEQELKLISSLIQ
jgi:importin-7